MKKVLLIDNYDSFTANLAQLLEESGMCRTKIVLNDQISTEDAQQYDAIVISPGPGLPGASGICKSLVLKYADSKPILGICLGHQIIAEVFGARLFNLGVVQHGQAADIRQVTDDPVFHGLDKIFKGGLYHSWAVDSDTIEEPLQVTAVSNEGVVMAIKHCTFHVHGLQFHPESYMTSSGQEIINNWLKLN